MQSSENLTEVSGLTFLSVPRYRRETGSVKRIYMKIGNKKISTCCEHSEGPVRTLDVYLYRFLAHPNEKQEETDGQQRVNRGALTY